MASRLGTAGSDGGLSRRDRFQGNEKFRLPCGYGVSKSLVDGLHRVLQIFSCRCGLWKGTLCFGCRSRVQVRACYRNKHYDSRQGSINSVGFSANSRVPAVNKLFGILIYWEAFPCSQGRQTYDPVKGIRVSELCDNVGA